MKRFILFLAFLSIFACSLSAQVKTLSYGTNGVVIYNNANPLTFTNNITLSNNLFTINEPARENLRSQLQINGITSEARFTGGGDPFVATKINTPSGIVTFGNGLDGHVVSGFGTLFMNYVIGGYDGEFDGGSSGAGNFSILRNNEVIIANDRYASGVYAGIKSTGNDGFLRFIAANLERANIDNKGDLTLLASMGALQFGAANTQGAKRTRNNLGFDDSSLIFYTMQNTANQYIASTVTGTLSSVFASYGDGTIALTNPSGRGLPFYRLNSGSSTSRTNSDLAAIRSSYGSQPYFSGPIRTKIDWSSDKYIYMRIASPSVGSGQFQFTFGETTSPTFSTNVNGLLPIPSETFIGFSLTRTNSPAQWIPRVISRASSTSSIITNIGSLMSTNAIIQVTRFLLEYRAQSAVVTLSTIDSSGVKNTIVSQTNANTFSNAINPHQVNWLMGVCPTPPTGTNTIGIMQYDVEPPIILQ